MTKSQRRIETFLLVVGLIAVALVVTTSFAVPVPSGTLVAGSTPIQHVFVIMKENHAFDNYFGTFPGADGIPSGASVPDGNGGAMVPDWIASTSTDDLPHSRESMIDAWHNGSNDRSPIVAERWGPGRGLREMGSDEE